MLNDIERLSSQIQDTTALIRALHGATVIERNTILSLAVSLVRAVQSGDEREIARLSAAILVFGDQSVEPKMYYRGEGLT